MLTGITEMPEKGYTLEPLVNGMVRITMYKNPVTEQDADGNEHVSANLATLDIKNFSGLEAELDENLDWYWTKGEAAQTEKLTKQFTQAVQSWMDAKVQERGYDNIASACTYALSSDITFAAEGTAAKNWRDKVWRMCYDIVGDVVSGKRAVPSITELLNELPKLEW